MTDPRTPTDEQDQVPAEEEEPETIETGAWMDERDAEPSESPDPVEP
jgi:hypothetical protein